MHLHALFTSLSRMQLYAWTVELMQVHICTCGVHGFHEELYALGPGLSVWYNQRGHWAGLVVFGVSAVLAVASLHIFGVQTHVPGKLLLGTGFSPAAVQCIQVPCCAQDATCVIVLSRLSQRRLCQPEQHVVEPCTLMLIIGSAGSVCLCSLAHTQQSLCHAGHAVVAAAALLPQRATQLGQSSSWASGEGCVAGDALGGARIGAA